MKCVRLPFHFDVPLLQKELSLFKEEWKVNVTPRTEPDTYWNINLMMPDLSADRIDGTLPFKWHPILESCPYLTKVLGQFKCDYDRVMFRLLKAGKGFTKHRDPMSYDRGDLRIHIPIVTDDLFEIYFNDERIRMLEGECWYLHTTMVHWGINNSTNDRIHLILDCNVNEWWENIFADYGFPKLNKSYQS